MDQKTALGILLKQLEILVKGKVVPGWGGSIMTIGGLLLLFISRHPTQIYNLIITLTGFMS